MTDLGRSLVLKVANTGHAPEFRHSPSRHRLVFGTHIRAADNNGGFEFGRRSGRFGRAEGAGIRSLGDNPLVSVQVSGSTRRPLL